MSLSNEIIKAAQESQQLSTQLPTVTTGPISSSPSVAPLSASSNPVAADASGGLGNISGNVNYRGTAPVVVDSDLTITSTSTNGLATLNGARVLIANFDASKDRLGIDGVTSGSENGVSWNYDQSRGVLTLDSTNGVGSDIYQGLLRRVTYANTDASNPGQARNIQFSLGNLLANPENGHFYQFVTNAGIYWTDARTATNGLNYLGRQGYLTTITTQAEQDFVQSRVSGNGWIGASDAAVEGDWRWVTGPEGLASDNGGTGQLYWRGNSTGAAIDGRYNNWDLQRSEPNNSIDAGKPNGEDYAHIVGDANAGNIGKWNDLPDQQDYSPFPAYRPQGYIVEYGGLSTDSSPTITAGLTLSFDAVGATGTPAVGTTTNVPNFDVTPGSTTFNIPELLWRNYNTNAAVSSTGQNAIWGLSYDSGNVTNAFTRSADPKLTKLIQEAKDTNWEIEGLYDVDANGSTDIFWRNYRTGENAVWFMRFDATTGIELDTKTQFLGPEADVSWEIEGVTNYDNTGGPEILWHNYRTGETAIWGYDFNNNTLTRNASRTKFVGQNTNTDWIVEGWADFDKDNIADILWRNYRTGENAVWKLNADASGSNFFTSGYFIELEKDAFWEVADVIDFDRDGVADIVWRNYRTGENAVWGMLSGAGRDATKTDFVTQTDTAWRFEGSADFTGDNIPDFVWRNYRTGENAIWRMNISGSKLVRDAGFFINPETDLAWEIEGPSPTRDRA